MGLHCVRCVQRFDSPVDLRHCGVVVMVVAMRIVVMVFRLAMHRDV